MGIRHFWVKLRSDSKNWVSVDSSWLLPGSPCIYYDRNSAHSCYQPHTALSPLRFTISSCNETHPSNGLEFTEFPLSQGTRPKASYSFLQLQLSLFGARHSVHVLKSQAIHQLCRDTLEQLSFIILHLSLSPHIDGYNKTTLIAVQFALTQLQPGGLQRGGKGKDDTWKV